MFSSVCELATKAVADFCQKEGYHSFKGNIRVSQESNFEPDLLRRQVFILNSVLHRNRLAVGVPLESKYQIKVDEAQGGSTSTAIKTERTKQAELGLSLGNLKVSDIFMCGASGKGAFVKTGGTTETTTADKKSTNSFEHSCLCRVEVSPGYEGSLTGKRVITCKRVVSEIRLSGAIKFSFYGIPEQSYSIASVLEAVVASWPVGKPVGDLSLFASGTRAGDNFLMSYSHDYEEEYVEFEYYETEICDAKNELEKEVQELKLKVQKKDEEINKFKLASKQSGTSSQQLDQFSGGIPLLKMNSGMLSSQSSILAVYGYGYGWQRHGVLLNFQEKIAELIDLKQPDQVPIDQRVELCLKYDKEHFADEHYLADLFEPDGQLIAAINFEIDENTHLVLNDLDREQLKNLRIRQLDGFGLKSMQQLISYSLLDLVGAYLYDLRTTDVEHSVESGWTIRKLSPSLSFLVQWPDAKAAMAGFLRRSLVFPRYRSWQLSLKVLDDIVLVLQKGRSAILKCLLQIRRLFNLGGNDSYYLFNQLFLDDFCLWIQSVDDSVITSLTEQFKLAKNEVKKECLDLDLDCVELKAGLELLNMDGEKKN